MTKNTAVEEAIELLVWATGEIADDFGFAVRDGKLIAEQYDEGGGIISTSVLTITESPA